MSKMWSIIIMRGSVRGGKKYGFGPIYLVQMQVLLHATTGKFLILSESYILCVKLNIFSITSRHENLQRKTRATSFLKPPFKHNHWKREWYQYSKGSNKKMAVPGKRKEKWLLYCLSTVSASVSTSGVLLLSQTSKCRKIFLHSIKNFCL